MRYKTDLEDESKPRFYDRKMAKHPRVKATAPNSEDDTCTLAVNRLKAGPPNVPQIILDGNKW